MKIPLEEMQIQVKNFGPIYKAEFNLRPLTVFVGPSNTGKTYLATLLYALHQFFGAFPFHLTRLEHFQSKERPSQKMTKHGKAREMVIKQLKRAMVGNSPKADINFPAEVINYKIDDEKTLSEEIRRCFGQEKISSFFRWRSARNIPNIVLEKTIQDNLIHKYQIQMQEEKVKVEASINDDLVLPVDVSTMVLPLKLKIPPMGETLEEYFDWLYTNVVDNMVRRKLIFPFHRQAFYMPADRAGIMHAHKTVVSSLLIRASREGARTATMSGVLSDFMNQLIKIDLQPDLKERKSLKHNSVWKNIETKILKGKVSFFTDQSLVKYPDFTYRPDGWPDKVDDLSLMNASSMVSELAPIVLFLKHTIEPNNFIIIEEPESHLHPAMQVELTRQLATLAKCGIKVLVTTHSEWILEELANIIKRSSVPEKPNLVSLEPEKVGTWLFGPSGDVKGTTVRPIELDESGLYPSGFDEVAASLHNDWAEIVNKVKN